MKKIFSHCEEAIHFSKRVFIFFIFSTLIFQLTPRCVLARNPAEVQQAINLAYNAHLDEALNLLGKYIVKNPEDPLGYIYRATTNDWKQKLFDLRGALDDQALDDLKKGNTLAYVDWEYDQDNIEKNIILANSYMYLAKKYIDMGKKSRAGFVLKKCQKLMEFVLSKDPTRYEAYLAPGLFQFYASHIPPGYQFLAELLGMSGNERQGIEAVQKTASQPNLLQSDALYALSVMMGETKHNYRLALPYVAQLIALYPNNPQFRFMKGDYAMRAGSYDVAHHELDDFLTYCKTAGNSCNKHYIFIANYLNAQALDKLKKWNEALLYIDAALSKDIGYKPEKTANLWYMKGAFLYKLGKTPEALTALKNVEVYKKDNPAVWEKTEALRNKLQSPPAL